MYIRKGIDHLNEQYRLNRSRYLNLMLRVYQHRVFLVNHFGIMLQFSF